MIQLDIKGFFDNISHDWIINHIPMDRRILTEFLKAGYMDPYLWSKIDTEAGVPQGGIISPIIANMVLDGMNDKIISHLKSKGVAKFALDKVCFVRYADDVIVSVPSEFMMKLTVQGAELHLKTRGLMLNTNKTILTKLNKPESKFIFLGIELIYKLKPTPWGGKEWSVVLACPSPASIIKIKLKVKEIFKNGLHLSLSEIIDKINPVLRGWANYYSFTSASREFKKIQIFVWQKALRWGMRKLQVSTRIKVFNQFTISSKLGRSKTTFGYLDTNNKKVTIYDIGAHKIVYYKNPVDVTKRYYLKLDKLYFEKRNKK